MKIRRILATAVAAAVTTPVVFLSAAPAFADSKPAGAAEQQTKKPTIEELRLAVTKAQAAYDAAVVAVEDAKRALTDLDKADNALKVAAANAKKAAETAATAKTEADAKLATAEAALKALPDTATAEEKAAAETAVADAKTAAATAKTEAETKATAAAQADKAYDDAAVAASTRIGEAQKAKTAAAKALDEAKAALKAAEEEQGEDECDLDPSVGTSITGPKKITAGSSGVFTLRVTNKGKVQMDEVGGGADVFRMDGTMDDSLLHLTWSSVNSPKWQPIDLEEGFSSLAAVKPGGSFDFKLKVTVDAKTPAGAAAVVGGGAYVNKDGSCGWSEEGDYAEFTIAKAGKPAPGKDTGSTGGNGDTTQQGGSSKTPVTGGTTGSTTGGSLAKTGSSSSNMPIALAGGAAVVLGAGAMVVARRRKAGADA
ncbi:LPXTG cell wall anchor domain-containing protein [Streptomyces sp. NPDC085481]|uniref:LPXTG cell wall anchor domain-containing protein n=1 Tax=Streptomyces sp. NPDC085481 TaxID=3365727 RepID=UPI0037D464FB